jgi:hypothetical protein
MVKNHIILMFFLHFLKKKFAKLQKFRPPIFFFKKKIKKNKKIKKYIYHCSQKKREEKKRKSRSRCRPEENDVPPCKCRTSNRPIRAELDLADLGTSNMRLSWFGRRELSTVGRRETERGEDEETRFAKGFSNGGNGMLLCSATSLH